MQLTDTGHQLYAILQPNLEPDTKTWLLQKIERIVSDQSARDLFLTYTLLGNRVVPEAPGQMPSEASEVYAYVRAHSANLLELSRIYLLTRVLEEDPDFFVPKVAQLIQVADTGELGTFLRYLVLLPRAEAFVSVGAEALRTNIATIFDAIALDNPYPARYFNEQQWNQMYLKAAFMQRELGRIRDVDNRANKELARIISDYAHERWAASREVDPLFWRPVSNFLEGVLLEDMKRLFASENPAENRTAALCCYHSNREEAGKLLHEKASPLEKQIKDGSLSWANLNK